MKHSIFWLNIAHLNSLWHPIHSLRFQYIVLVGRHRLHPVVHDLLGHDLLAVDNPRAGGRTPHRHARPPAPKGGAAERGHVTAAAKAAVQLVKNGATAEAHAKAGHTQAKTAEGAERRHGVHRMLPAVVSHDQAAATALLVAPSTPHHVEPGERIGHGERVHKIFKGITPAEKLSEDVERVLEGERGKAEGKLFVKLVCLASTAPTGLLCARGQSLLAVLVVDLTFLLVGEHLVGLGNLFKDLGGLVGVVGVLVRVPFEGQFPVGLLDLAGLKRKF